MNKKISAGVCISLIAVACAVTFVITWTVSFNMYNERFGDPVQRDEIASKLQEIDSYVRANYLYAIDSDKVNYGMFGGYISGIGDKNTIYMTAEEYSKLLSEQKGEAVTCGIIPEKEESGYLRVAGVYHGTSAEALGIQKGDAIISIDGTNVLDVGADAALKLLEGEEGARVTLTIQREGQVEGYPLVRRAIEIISAEGANTNNGTDNFGIIRVASFNRLTASQFNAAVKDCIENGARALIIDLRGNGGDYYEALGDMLGGFIGPTTVAQSVSKNGIPKDMVISSSEKSVNIPVIAVVNSETSGAGELMASTLKGFANAFLVGNTTSGTSTIQTTHKLKDGSAVKVTFAEILPLSEAVYAGTGLTPDYVVETSLNVGAYDINALEITVEIPDAQLKKAFEIAETITAANG